MQTSEDIFSSSLLNQGHSKIENRAKSKPTRPMHIFLALLAVLVLLLCSSGVSKKGYGGDVRGRGNKGSGKVSKALSTSQRQLRKPDASPYSLLARYLCLYEDSDFPALSKACVGDTRRALERLSSSQQALKATDGAAHQLHTVMSDKKVSLQARYQSFLRRPDLLRTGEKRGRRSTIAKEAGKLYEYINTVERGLQACEVLQGAAIPIAADREVALKNAGLREVARTVVQRHGVHVAVSVLIPTTSVIPDTAGTKTVNKGESTSRASGKAGGQAKLFASGEIVLALVDVNVDVEGGGHKSSAGNTVTESLLESLDLEPVTLRLRGMGLMQEEVCVQPVALAIARDVLSFAAPHLVPATQKEEARAGEKRTGPRGDYSDYSGPDENGSMRGPATKSKKGYAFKVKPKQKQKPKPISKSKSKSKPKRKASASAKVLKDGGEIKSVATPGQPFTRTTIGGFPLPQKVRVVGFGMGGAAGCLAALGLEGCLNVVSLGPNNSPEEKGKGRGKADGGAGAKEISSPEMCVGLYPGAVRAVTLGAPPTLSRAVVPPFVTSLVGGDDMVPRTTAVSLRELKARADAALRGGVRLPGAHMFGDMAGLAAQSLKQYTGGAHDLTSLSPAGRVFYLKARQRKGGASLQRVLRGNWREDVLWQLHQVLLTGRMLQHHSIENYVNILSRC